VWSTLGDLAFLRRLLPMGIGVRQKVLYTVWLRAARVEGESISVVERLSGSLTARLG
jgi:hypothetical protein